MDKKEKLLPQLLAYAGKRKVLTYLSLAIASISQLLALAPFLYIWAILRDVIAGDYSRIAHFGWMAVAFAIASILVYFGGLMCSHVAAFRIAANMRKTLMQHIMSLPIGFLDSLGSGKVRKWVQESTQSTETYLAHQLPDKAGMYATMLGLAVLMFLFDWRMGLLCLATVVLALIVMLSLMTGSKLKRKMGEYNKALDAMSNEAVEYVRGIPVVKTFGQSVFSFKRFKDSIDQYRTWVIAYTIDLRLPMTLYTTFVNASFAMLIGLTLMVANHGNVDGEYLLNLLYYVIITPAIAVTLNRIMFASENEMIVAEALDKTGQMVLKLGIATVALTGAYLLAGGGLNVLTLFMFLLVASRLYDPMSGSLINLGAVVSLGVQCERMDEILCHEEQRGTESLSNKGYDVEFKDARFAYDTSETVLDGVSFTARQGEVTALIGPSGSGKTTVSRLASRFWDIPSGTITVGGMDISKIDPETLMSLYSIVFQDVTLFNNTVLENIRIGRKDATDEEVIAAARLAHVDAFAEKMPDGWNSLIGENGSELSGGVRQRISIARAFLKDAPIILLDEATASLDVENETFIQESLSRLVKDKTVIIIAHRMRTVAGVDKIVVLKDGCVAECGTPADLTASGGFYKKMQELQQGALGWNL